MTTIPVLWVSRYDHILARGYADQGFLEAILARTIWTPQDALNFEHHEVRGDFPDVTGAFVVLPARHHTSDEDVVWFKTQLDRLDWSVVLLAGDEEWTYPWQQIEETERRRVWIMQPEPCHEKLSGLIPGGWYPGTDLAMAAEQERAAERPLDWMFAGQVTHVRREACVEVLRELPLDAAVLHETDGYLRGMPQPEYWRLLSGAKVVPCPSGPMTVDTARTLEALEAGAIPISDLQRPNDPQFDYWRLVFRDPDCPLPATADWTRFPEMMREQITGWPATSNMLFAYWQAWKRRIVLQLDDDLRTVAHLQRELGTVDDRITVVITTSPSPLHPDTTHLETTLDSIRAQLPHAEILIGVDGVRPEQEGRRTAYDEYVRRVLWLANNRWRNVLPLLAPGWIHQANVTRMLLREVRTPLILFVEHDTPLVGEPVDWPALCSFVESGQANAVRLHHEASILPDHTHLMLDPEPQQVETPDGVLPVRRTSAWWARPHLAAARFYHERIMPIFAPESRTYIEDVLYGIVTAAVERHGEAGWWDWRVWIYSPAGDMKRSGHLDSRDSDPKFGMVYAYPDQPPAGAPSPTRIR